jgi:RecJ-like exonuclease
MAETPQSLKDFELSIKKASKIVKEQAETGRKIKIISHIDADGLAAASIIGKALARKEALLTIQTWKQVDDHLIQELSTKEKSLIIFTDLGSGSLESLKAKLPNKEVLVFDHHQPINAPTPTITQVNPHRNGFDGSKEISGAGVAYLTAKSMDKINVDLAPLAVIGALGDAQDKNEKRELVGFNNNILKDATDAGLMKTEKDLIFYGRETRPIHKALAYTTNPYIPGLSGKEDNCLGFLVNLGINLKIKDRWRSISDLTVKEKQTIFSELVKFLSTKSFANNITLSLVGTVYTLVNEDRWIPLRDAREFSSLLNACGRMNKSGIGIAIGMGGRGKILEEAQEVLINYKKTLSEYMEWLTKTPKAIEEFEHIYVINGTGVINELMLSTIASILSSNGIFNYSKPILALTSAEKGMIKVSGRIPPHITHGRSNFGKILHNASSQFGGKGGGHDVAAGAKLPQECENEFIRIVNQMFGSSIQ